MDTPNGWVDDKATLFYFPFPLYIFVFLDVFFFLGAGAELKSISSSTFISVCESSLLLLWISSSTHSFKKNCQFLPLHQRISLLYRNHNQNIHNYSLCDYYYFFWGRVCLRKLPYLFYESVWCLQLWICDVSVKTVVLIHLIKGLAYPTDSWGHYRPHVNIWTWTIPTAAVVWGKLCLRSSFLREPFLKGPSQNI